MWTWSKGRRVFKTFRQCCKGSTSTLFQARLGGVLGTGLHQAGARPRFWHTKTRWPRETELRELREKVEWHEGAERKQGTQGKPAGAQGSVEEDGKMEVDEEVDSKKKLESAKTVARC